MVVIFTEATPDNRASLNARELHTITEAARLFGCRVYPIPSDFAECGNAANALAYVPNFEPPVPGIWVGYIPAVERYTDLYTAARARGIHLVNTPDEHRTATEFDRFYPLLGELTPVSIVVRTVEECAAAGIQLGFPVFVKGLVKSDKAQGWAACVAGNEAELHRLAEGILANAQRSRQHVVVRRLVKLRTTRAAPGGFPLGREYRVFVYRQQVLAYGYYWDEFENAIALAATDEQTLPALAVEAARRTGVPFVAVDIGQMNNGAWIVIEIGDGQFSGLSRVPVLELWSKLAALSLEGEQEEE